MNLENLKDIIKNNLENKTAEAKRVFHGRGKFYENFSYLTVDSFNNVFFATFYEENIAEEKILELLKNIAKSFNFENFIIQRKYKDSEFYELIFGEIPENFYVLENSLKYKINFKNRNLGLFFDIKDARAYIKSISKSKTVLNLFSYTCAFSVSSIAGGAKSVINIDMSSNSLNIGRENHNINNLDTKKVKFFSYDILKSFGKIKKLSPYDIIIIDPPSFQKGSFILNKDYEKVIKRLDEYTNSGAIILACLNDPFIESEFIKELFNKYLINFKYLKRIPQNKEFVINDEEKGLKSLVFIKN
ncbi:MAG TPA: class I SAM-dependent methyltransferase [Aliarcobacter thereius]|nr:class I SAM-dependent methyltransferase [Aliarcobacter thereius]HJE03477.1 class I SAM-dependent methyltransferase [Aliarcobacter thereius]